MRVVAGSVRGFNLIVPSGKNTRPTTNSIKETLFNILQWDIAGCRFLDLFSGSGGIAIEALSRGAKEAVMVEKDREAVRCIKQNVQHTKMDDRSRVMPMDVMQALRRLEQAGQPFDKLLAGFGERMPVLPGAGKNQPVAPVQARIND